MVEHYIEAENRIKKIAAKNKNKKILKILNDGSKKIKTLAQEQTTVLKVAPKK